MSNNELGKISSDYIGETDKVIWEDKKRILGKPISFTKYRVTEKRFIEDRGLVNNIRNSMELYRVMDIKLTRTMLQKLLGVGTIHMYTSDSTCPETYIMNIVNPEEVMQLLTQLVEKEKAKRIKMTEFMGSTGIN